MAHVRGQRYFERDIAANGDARGLLAVDADIDYCRTVVPSCQAQARYPLGNVDFRAFAGPALVFALMLLDVVPASKEAGRKERLRRTPTEKAPFRHPHSPQPFRHVLKQ